MKDENRELYLKTEELRACSIKELQAVIEDSQQRLLEIRHQSQLRPNPKPHQIKALKKQIARCETIIKEKMQITHENTPKTA